MHRSRRLLHTLAAIAAVLPASLALAQATKPADAKPADAKAAPKKLPTPQEIQDRFIEVTGGRAAHEKGKHRVIKGIYEMASLKVKAPVEIWQAPGRKFHQSLEIPEIGKVEEGSDGLLVWERGPNGTRFLADKEKAHALRDNDVELELKLFEPGNFALADTTGIEKVGDRDAYKISMIAGDGASSERFYDVESGLLIRQTRNIQVQGGTQDLPTEAFYEDYRETSIGTKIPHRQRQRILTAAFKDRADAIWTISALEYPESIDKAKFELPPEVKEYLEALKHGEQIDPAHTRGDVITPGQPAPPPPTTPPANPAPAPKP